MTNLEKFTDIVSLYARFFNIEESVTEKSISLYSDAQLVAKLNLGVPHIFEYKGAKKWNKCKTTDLLTVVLHGFPLHGK